VLKEKHKFRGSIPFPLMSKGESCRQGENSFYSWESCRELQGENSFYAWWTMCFVARFPSMTKGEIVGIIVIDVKGFTLHYNTHNISKIDLYI
jgi:hypothetical protein